MDPWQRILKLDSVESTNDYVSGILKETKPEEGSVYSSLFQSAGKGIGQNKWESEKGKNLLFSLVLYPSFLPVENQFLISKTVSLGIANYIQAKTNNIKIKWPNDIYYKEKKIAGILIENSIKGSNLNSSIIGIGFNLNQAEFKSDTPNPVSLNQITKKTYSIDQELVKIRTNIRFFYDKLKAGKFEEINQEYLKCLYRFNEIHDFKTGEEIFKARITGINKYGHLQLTTENNEIREYGFKETEFVI
jgi:BirA family transcriptional regulator, biotin operon repressor / biotin---[acetyl-CoA-carboxylase] ligase